MQIRKRNYVADALGCIGVLTAITLRSSVSADDWGMWGVPHFIVVVLAGPSAWLSGKLFGRMFGGEGGQGWVIASMGAILSTIVGAMIAGTIIFPVLGTMAAPYHLIAIGLSDPMIWITWLVSMSMLHMIVCKSKNHNKIDV